MAAQIKYMILFPMSVVANMIIALQINGVEGDPEVPCFFIFGDSLADNGNNYPRATLAKANYRPYRIDFPCGIPTGRFNNGRTSADVLGQLLEFDDFIPPCATATDDVILKAANYASEAAGIHDETGYQVGYDCLTQQTVKQPQPYHPAHHGPTKKQNRCPKSLEQVIIYYVGMGKNDYLNNYFLPQFCNTSTRYTPEEYAQELINQYSNQITRLYNLGARKVALIGVGVLGRIPNAISTYGANGSACVDRFNNAAQIFNGKLVALLNELNNRYSADAKFIYVNSVELTPLHFF